MFYLDVLANVFQRFPIMWCCFCSSLWFSALLVPLVCLPKDFQIFLWSALTEQKSSKIPSCLVGFFCVCVLCFFFSCGVFYLSNKGNKQPGSQRLPHELIQSGGGEKGEKREEELYLSVVVSCCTTQCDPRLLRLSFLYIGGVFTAAKTLVHATQGHQDPDYKYRQCIVKSVFWCWS